MTKQQFIDKYKNKAVIFKTTEAVNVFNAQIKIVTDRSVYFLDWNHEYIIFDNRRAVSGDLSLLFNTTKSKVILPTCVIFYDEKDVIEEPLPLFKVGDYVKVKYLLNEEESIFKVLEVKYQGGTIKYVYTLEGVDFDLWESNICGLATVEFLTETELLRKKGIIITN